jgi:RND family efflux transporter MFP subunit
VLFRSRQGYAICTVPLVYGGDIVGALTMERRDREFSPAEATHIERIAAMLAPSLALKYEIGLSPWRRCRTQFRAAVGKRLRSDTPASRPLRIGLGVAGAALAALLLIPTPHSVTAPARLEGAMQRVLTAPADGYLQKVYVRPGDRVRSGQILAELADQDMAVELRGLEAELAQHENALISAQARNDSAEYSASQGRYLAARARHDLVRQQIERTHLRAPFDGVVIKGDLNQTVGAPVERGAELITLAPDTGYRVLLEAEEAEIADLREGQAGQLKLAAMPSLAIPLRIERITPLASTEQGRHYFAVYASLQGKLPSLRPGMQGFARIEIDSRSMLFDALRRAFDRARLMIWSWGA